MSPKILISVSKNSNIYLLLADISQTVHDFAISFFRSSKTKGLFSSILENIEGLGPKRRELLLKHFITIDAIKKASKEELIEAGLSESVAINVIEYFNENE